MFNNIKRFSFVFVCFLLVGIMVSCGGAKNKNVTISTKEVYDKITNGVELPKLNQISSSEIESLTSITSSNYDEATFSMSMMNVQATEIAIFKFSSKEQSDAIDKGITKRLEDLEVTWSKYLPDQYELVKGVKKFTEGNIKGYIIADNAAKILENLQKLVK
ncbi:DUF4358 domain-containing protein [Candidatus Arthromitus sp. SFB-rat-Yit]|uniref:DUF4358 domain-containing protein n=1 Tax=Candidatus Arthromitus sp. SFB-rat-Yit TaxID=1041504 RepID=UPI0003114C4C|nr:DUF4358 domain-containing protein [Candidatus Arthromitus sp. SFB-rat-Yit]